MQSGIKEILTEEGRIDALVNAAGYGSYGALEEVPLSEAREQFEVNVFGAGMTRARRPHGGAAQPRGCSVRLRVISGLRVASRMYETLPRPLRGSQLRRLRGKPMLVGVCRSS